MTVTSAQVTTLLENVLFESATLAAQNAPSWTAIANLNTNTSTVAGLSAYLATQPEAQIAERVVQYYQGALSRVPSAFEINYYVAQAEAGLNATQVSLGTSGVSDATWASIAAEFAASPEFKADFGLTGGITTANAGLVVTGFYANILGRAPSASEISYYANQLTAGVSAFTLLQDFTQSPEYQNKANPTILAELGANGAAAVTSAAAGGTPSTSTTPIGVLPVITTPGGTFNLTSGIDSFTGSAGGNNSFIATDATGGVSTLGPLDSINGGGGTGNTLTWVHTGAITTPTGATISNIQTATVSGTTTVSLDTTKWTGLTTLNITDTADVGVKAATTTTVNELAATGAVKITQAGAVNVNESGPAANVSVKNAAGAVIITDTGKSSTVSVSAAGAAVTVTAKNTITIGGGTTISATDSTGVAYATQVADLAAKNAAAAAASTADAAYTAASTEVTNLATLVTNVSGDATVAAELAHTLAAENAGTITLAQMQSINAAYYDAFNATGGTAVKAQAAATAVLATIQSTAATAKSAANATKTTADAAKTAATAVVTADATKGSHTIQTGTSNSALASATATGDYSGAVTITDHTTLKNTLTTVTLNNAGAATLTGNSLTTVNDTSGQKNVSITNTTLNHTETFNLDNVAPFNGGGTPVLTDANATTIVINNLDTSKVSVVAAAATKMTITGSGSFSDTTALGQAAAVIDASAATGSVSVLITQGQKFTGGSGATTVEETSATQTKAVNGGTGTANTLIIDNAAVATSTAAALFSGFSVLKDSAAGAINVGLFSATTFTSITLNNATADVTGLNATQAGAITDTLAGADAGIIIGVKGASTVGQLDTVHITMNDGSGASAAGEQTLTTPTLTGVETLHITLANGATVSSLANALALTAVNVDGTGNFSLATGAIALNVNTVIDAHLVAGTVTLNATGATANGLELIGSATKANTLIGNNFSDVFVGGAGNDTISNGVGAANLTQSVTDGNGNDTITLNDTGHKDTDTITVGNGFNTITDKTIDGTVTVTVGTGSNVIDLHTGAAATYSASVTLGTHLADQGLDTIKVGVEAAAYTAINTKITGAVTGDQVVIVDAATAYTALTTAQQTTVTGEANIGAALTYVDGLLAAHGSTSFTYGGNTYLLESVAGAGVGVGDTFVELVGTHTFSLTAATHTYTLLS
jgi:hypothetical protein